MASQKQAWFDGFGGSFLRFVASGDMIPLSWHILWSAHRT